eukprot:CAMPEP_0117429936 /NCGR_PEP_ID=MMETSP0758-20121206/9470_1 /TAXON_ID=63605 /ORGANISM="Percolomonas cosmopolitus, Strain AE-1 (ATCC 50343)" /LENGTH=137 /DNA_ID=CAMNT_0005217443 /DNA_START=24 /DNA_END=434 /DNA_ORIENTATION=+
MMDNTRNLKKKRKRKRKRAMFTQADVEVLEKEEEEREKRAKMPKLTTEAIIDDNERVNEQILEDEYANEERVKQFDDYYVEVEHVNSNKDPMISRISKMDENLSEWHTNHFYNRIRRMNVAQFHSQKGRNRIPGPAS